MTTHDEPLPAHLEQIGRQLTSAASARGTSAPHRWRARSLVGLPVAAGVAAAVVLLTSAGPATPPAYALTPHADGTYTLTINDIATAVSQVNAEFAKLGINARAIPVTSSCTASTTGFPAHGSRPEAEHERVDHDR